MKYLVYSTINNMIIAFKLTNEPLLSAFLVISQLIAISDLAFSQQWELRKSKDGINIYTKKVPNSGIDAFKAEMETTGSIEKADYILRNLDQFKDIFPDTKELEIIERPSKNVLIQYSQTAAPWPADDRDGIFEITFLPNPENGGIHTKARALPNHLPKKSGIVRVEKSNSSWKVYPTSKGKIKVIYEVQAEPGGNIPDWLANMATTEIPHKTMSNLRDALKK